jgi:hypothetical protein
MILFNRLRYDLSLGLFVKGGFCAFSTFKDVKELIGKAITIRKGNMFYMH